VADLVKSVLGGTWSLIIGWILPTYISFQLVAALVLPGMREFEPVNQFFQFSSPTRQFALLAAAAIAGLVLAAAQAPLYRILEGYLLWPAGIGNRRIERHQERFRELTDAQAAAAKTNKGVRSGLLYERAARYPAQERQFAPTALGNAIRRFETYARDRYMLDSQLLWHHLTTAAPDRAVAAVDNARTNVDFFVCLVYGGSATATLGIVVVASGHASVQSGVAIIAGIVIAIGCYRLALLATDEWSATVRALVDHGRAGVAAAFGMHIPADFDSEREMWRAICTLVRRSYAYSEEREISAIIARYRSSAEDVSSKAAASIGADRSDIVQTSANPMRKEGRVVAYSLGDKTNPGDTSLPDVTPDRFPSAETDEQL
jgi:hypothetical protein